MTPNTPHDASASVAFSSVTAATGTGALSVPLGLSPGCAGFGPQLALTYDSDAGNGEFGQGWSLALPSIAGKSDKSLPTYDDAIEGLFAGFAVTSAGTAELRELTSGYTIGQIAHRECMISWKSLSSSARWRNKS